MKKIQDNFVSNKIALVLRKLGFNEDCLAIYRNAIDDLYVTLISDGIQINGTQSSKLYCNTNNVIYCTAPLYQQVVDWFREEHNLIIAVDHEVTMKWFAHVISKAETQDDYELEDFIHVCSHEFDFDTYEEARDWAIDTAIELIKQK